MPSGTWPSPSRSLGPRPPLAAITGYSRTNRHAPARSTLAAMMGAKMTTAGRRSAFVFGVLLALSLPKQVPCEVPGASCEVRDPDGRACQPTDVEPFGIYLVEWLVRRDLPVA